MEYLLDLGFTNDDITILNGTVEASVLEKLKIFKTLVKVNYDYIKGLAYIFHNQHIAAVICHYALPPFPSPRICSR